MAAREDLLAVADRLAARARELADGDAHKWIEAAQAAAHAKTALEAAALVGPATTADEITAALNELTDELVAAGVFEESSRMAPSDFLRAMLRGIGGLQQELVRTRKFENAYVELGLFVAGLAREMEGAANARRADPDDPSRRLARRLNEAIERGAQETGLDPRKAAPTTAPG